MESRGRAEDLFNQGIALKDRGQRESAIAVFRQVLAIDPRHPRALHELRVLPWARAFGSRA